MVSIKKPEDTGKPVPKLLFSIPLLLLAGCSTEANHIGNPLTWPVTSVGSALSNVNYDARRAQVSDFVTAHQAMILRQAMLGGGPELTGAMNLADVPEARRSALIKELTNNPIYFNNTEALVVALMVHGR